MSEENLTDDELRKQKVFYPSKVFQEKAYIKSSQEYDDLYKQSIENPEKFWAKFAEEITWFKKWDKVMENDFSKGEIKWFTGGKLNVSYNCLDRHLNTFRKNKAAIIWESESGETKTFTYQELHRLTCKFANVLQKRGVKKGDRVAFYMPMLPELAIGMLACTRIGAIHSVVFGGFSANSLKDRLNDCEAKVLVTSDGGFRSGKVILLKQNADIAMESSPFVNVCLVVKRTQTPVVMHEGRDYYLDEELNAPDISSFCEAAQNDAEDPLFILYTSGSTGKPKGLLHTTGGYITYVINTFKYIFDCHEEDTYWCTADIGWITGHSYILYGPLALGATSIMFEGVPNYPAPDRFWEIIEKHKVNIFYTAPTAIRALAREGESWPQQRDLSSLRLLGSVGEPINPEAWLWYFKNIGNMKCPIVDTWWQTETGGIVLASLPGALYQIPGYAGHPFFGIKPSVIKVDGKEANADEEGTLVIKAPWPGMARTIYGNHQRYIETYFSLYPNNYFTGDGAKFGKDGDYSIFGRIDDVINVSGHRLGTAEIESALVANRNVAEAAVVGFPHEIKGQGIYAFVTLKNNVIITPALEKELVLEVRKSIGPIATPDRIQFTDGLPKTRSGKIMRRILRKIVEGKISEIGDTSTLADPTVIDKIIENKKEK